MFGKYKNRGKNKSESKKATQKEGVKLVLRVMDKNKGDAELEYDTCDMMAINKIVNDTVMPKLKEGWFLVGKTEGDNPETKMVMQGNEIMTASGQALIQKQEKVIEFMKDEKTTTKLLSLPLMSG